MSYYFYSFISFIILERIVELVRSRQNEKWLRENGAKEFGAGHYKYFIILHTLFLVSLVTEYNIRFTVFSFSFVNYLGLLIFTVMQFFRLSIFISLGKFWNTKIFVIPNNVPIKIGLYKYFRHPNYAIVITEIITIPLSFSLFYTLIIFSVLNLLLLRIRIKEENLALYGNPD
jgi:methyltransferase